MMYKAEYEDEEFELLSSDNYDDAFKEANEYEKEHGLLFNIYLLDDDYNEIETVY